MNLEHQVEDIREACIKANPNRFQYRVAGGDDFEEADDQTIRLADVLLAIEEKDPTNKYHVRTSGHIGTISPVSPMTHVYAQWNLRTDDLTKQSPECIAFIHKLITV